MLSSFPDGFDARSRSLSPTFSLLPALCLPAAEALLTVRLLAVTDSNSERHVVNVNNMELFVLFIMITKGRLPIFKLLTRSQDTSRAMPNWQRLCQHLVARLNACHCAS